MPRTMFERAIFAQLENYVRKIASVDDVLDFLNDWPQDQRDITYDVMIGACRKAITGNLPDSAVAENFRRFLKRHGSLAETTGLRA
ncbi:DUF982 domain-containing protein [Rhizobium sp. NPDC090275]|uniref:DUF982 domain-containing protein n=1 Tax=Rhizobium sp. NPDC090275 TaxID=3364498 RepID=UPI000DDDE72F